MDDFTNEPMCGGIITNALYNEESKINISPIIDGNEIYLVENVSTSSNYPVIKTESEDLNNENISIVCKEEPREYECDLRKSIHSIHYVKNETSQNFEQEYIIDQIKDEKVPQTEGFHRTGKIQPVEKKEIENNSGTDSGIDRKRKEVTKLLKCSLCDFSSTHKCRIEVHVDAVHLKLKPHKCDLCDFSSSYKCALQNHVNSVHLKPKNFNCDLCEYSSSRKDNLQQHMNSVHLKLKSHKCGLCDYSSSHKLGIRIHMSSAHCKLRNFKCHLCEYSSSVKGNLRIHINSVHLKLKPHKCGLCDYSSSAKCSLVLHMNTAHLNFKPHKCDLCEYSSPVKANLKNHMNSVHLKLKPHECGFCDYSASRKDHLQKHLNSSHSSNNTNITYAITAQVQKVKSI